MLLVLSKSGAVPEELWSRQDEIFAQLGAPLLSLPLCEHMLFIVNSRISLISWAYLSRPIVKLISVA